MKTAIKLIMVTTSVMVYLSASAQRSHTGVQNPSNHQGSPLANNQTTKYKGSSNKHYGPHWNNNVVVHIGGVPNPYYHNYGYHNFYNIKKASRNSIRQSASIIRQALHFGGWHDIFSPWLAKAIRHQQYAKQLYFWGDYAGALNHAERAGFLAWNTLDYFNNPYNYSYGNYPDPYSNPNNPYYRQGNSSPSMSNPEDDGMSFKKGANDNINEVETSKRRLASPDQKVDQELERSLPQNKLSDQDLLMVSPKELDIE